MHTYKDLERELESAKENKLTIEALFKNDNNFRSSTKIKQLKYWADKVEYYKKKLKEYGTTGVIYKVIIEIGRDMRRVRFYTNIPEEDIPYVVKRDFKDRKYTYVIITS